MFIVQVSRDAEISESEELYSEDGLEMVGCLALMLERGSSQALFTFPGTQSSSYW